MMFAPLASVFQFGSLLEWVSHTAVIAFALSQVQSMRAPQDPLEELTFRLRHPMRHVLAHPFRAMMRHWRNG